MFQEKIEGCFNGVLSKFQRSLKEVQWVFEESIQEFFKEVLRLLHGRMRGVPRKFHQYLKKLSIKSFNSVSRMFQ